MIPRGAICIVAPHDDLDPEALKWIGRRVEIIHKTAWEYMNTYRVKDVESGQTIVLRGDDLRKE